MRIKKLAAGLLALGLAAGSLSGCGSSDDSSKVSSAGADGPVTVEFWHSMTGAVNGPLLNQLIADYNKTNGKKITVKGVFQGNYDEAIAKYKAAAQTGSTPALMQAYDIGSRFMIDSGTIKPVQDFINAEKYDVSDLQPNIAGYYTIDKKLYSMPFNTSMPVFYYNKDVFKKAGLDPDKPPTTLAEIRTDAEAIKKARAAKYPFTSAIYGWFVEQEIAANGDLYCTPGNGRSGVATKMSFDNPTAVEFLEWWKKLIDDGLSINNGRDTAQNQTTFSSGASAMMLESTGVLGGFVKTANFNVGVGTYPKVNASSSGPIIGGASLWIGGKGHSSAEQAAAWDFIKYLSSPKVQAKWHVATGYFPISKAALKEPEVVSLYKKVPQFKVAVDQLAATKLSPATQGCAAGVMPQSRKAVEDALEKVLTTKADAKTTLEAAQKDITSQLGDYNSSVNQ